ncbi:MAG: DUF3836 domain-containing protein [Bacteroidales bacterium]|jgi:hypothetical protein|nr:DUF3836 domain-containing protein [Bacteroidales bacterium]MDD2264046.1 DUF3836 domain-containing protein [Bacteroidales bacterium]MDD2831280.1 DUF3836 domain-containing protein [Bacteroidales bacterium]MDD3208607.1 DUF3836 domain-containing protein [Bacteroidales bacterium]MDD3697170.1 DUF3836 domain-containing protein [Bacteroidales bacterium]
MKKLHFILLAMILTGCINDSWWEPRTIITCDESGRTLGRYQFTYDERGNKFTETGDLWDNETLTWTRNYRISYSYDIYGTRTGALKEKRDSVSGKWLPVSRVICHYTPEPRSPETEIHQIYLSETDLWEDTFRDHYIRDDQGRLLYIVREKWNNGEIDRDIALRGRFTIKAHVVTLMTGWENFIRDSFLYDQEGKMTGGRVDNWDNTIREWNPVFRYIYTYDKKGNVTMEIMEKWDTELGSWIERGRYAYLYDDHGNAVESHYTATIEDPGKGSYLVFFYNNMRSTVGYYLGDTGIFPGVRGTAAYFRQKR